MIALHLYKPTAYHRCETNSSVLKWSPPPEGMVAINVDAAIFATSCRMGMGIVIRDHNGKCLAVCSEQRREVVMPELAEALAIRRAVILAKDEGFSNIIVNSDCLSVVQRVNSNLEDRSLCGPIIRDIKMMAISFNSCSFCFVNRIINGAAHRLAKFSEFSGCCVWRGVTPECILR